MSLAQARRTVNSLYMSLYGKSLRVKQLRVWGFRPHCIIPILLILASNTIVSLQSVQHLPSFIGHALCPSVQNTVPSGFLWWSTIPAHILHVRWSPLLMILKLRGSYIYLCMYYIIPISIYTTLHMALGALP